jgi:hypothetical protein
MQRRPIYREEDAYPMPKILDVICQSGNSLYAFSRTMQSSDMHQKNAKFLEIYWVEAKDLLHNDRHNEQHYVFVVFFFFRKN